MFLWGYGYQKTNAMAPVLTIKKKVNNHTCMNVLKMDLIGI